MAGMSRSLWAGLVLVFILAAATRVGWVVARHARQSDVLSYPDEQAYQRAARSLVAGHGLVDEFGYRATYMPGYPLFLAAFERFGLPLMTVRVVQALLGALVAPMTFLLARQWRRMAQGQEAAIDSASGHPSEQIASNRIGLIAGVLAALDPFLIFFSGLLLTEVLFAVLLVACWWLVFVLLDRRRTSAVGVALAAGVLLLGAVMLRPSSTLLLLIVPLVLIAGHRFAVAGWFAATLIVGTVVVGLLPWGARNAALLGEWRWTTTRGGISLYDGVRSNTLGDSDLADTKSDPAVAGLDELQWDRHWHQQAIAAVRAHPERLARLAVRKFLRTWNIIPNEANARRGATAVISAVWMVAVLLSAGVGLWRWRCAAGACLALLAPVLGFTILHMIFVGSVRYRIPLMPMLFVLSAAGLAARRSTGEPSR